MLTIVAASVFETCGNSSSLTNASMVKAPSFPMTGNGASTRSSSPVLNFGFASRMGPKTGPLPGT